MGKRGLWDDGRKKEMLFLLFIYIFIYIYILPPKPTIIIPHPFFMSDRAAPETRRPERRGKMVEEEDRMKGSDGG